MANSLEQLKQFTTVVADTGDINGEREREGVEGREMEGEENLTNWI